MDGEIQIFATRGVVWRKTSVVVALLSVLPHMSSATASSSGSPPTSVPDAHAMEAVLPVSATRALELMEASAARVSPQQIGSLVRELNALRQHEIGHLKRVRRRDGELEVLLWAGAPDDYFGALPEPAQRALRSVGLPEAAHAVRVPRHAPATRAQFDAWNAVWPLTFHESACAHALAPWPPPPEPLERAKMAAHMRAAVELARRSAESGGRPVAALIVRRGDAADGAADGGELVLAACADGCCAPLLAGGGGGGGGKGAADARAGAGAAAVAAVALGLGRRAGAQEEHDERPAAPRGARARHRGARGGKQGGNPASARRGTGGGGVARQGCGGGRR